MTTNKVRVGDEIWEVKDWFVRKNQIDFDILGESEKVFVEQETEKAYCVGGLWVPKSCIVLKSPVQKEILELEKAIENKEISTIEDIEEMISNGKLTKENSEILLDVLYDFQEKYEEKNEETNIKRCRELKRKIRNFRNTINK